MAKIAIVGSVAEDPVPELGLRDPGTARHAAQAIGRELAQRGLAIVVYSADPQFIEADVVRGYVESGAAEPGSIEIRQPRTSGPGFAEAADASQLFDSRP